jgi:hypothetical protein
MIFFFGKVMENSEQTSYENKNALNAPKLTTLSPEGSERGSLLQNDCALLTTEDSCC